MNSNRLARIDEIAGIQVDLSRVNKSRFRELVKDADQLATAVIEGGQFRGSRRTFNGSRSPVLAAASAIYRVNTMLAQVSAMCTLSAPPADIILKPDESGSLVYRCYHAPAHEWNLVGERKR